MIAVHRPRRLSCPYMVKTFQNLLLQNQIIPGPNLCTNHWGWEVYQNCKNDGPPLMFVVRSNLLPHAFTWALYICIGKMLRSHILDICKDYGPIELKLDEEHWGTNRHKIGKTKQIENGCHSHPFENKFSTALPKPLVTLSRTCSVATG